MFLPAALQCQFGAYFATSYPCQTVHFLYIYTNGREKSHWQSPGALHGCPKRTMSRQVPEVLGCFSLPPYYVILEPLLQPRSFSKQFISFVYRLMEGKRGIDKTRGNYMVVQNGLWVGRSEVLGCFCLPPYNVILEPLLQPRTFAKQFISFVYRLMEGKRGIDTGTGHYMVVQMEYE
jgi:hypothetical protein